MRHILLGAATFALAFSLALRAQGRDRQTAADVPTEAQKIVLAVQQALGMIRGVNHIDAVNNVVLIGTDTMSVFGQAFRSDMPWPVFTLTHYQVSIKHSDWGLRAEIERTNPVGIIQGRGGLPLAAPQKLIQVVREPLCGTSPIRASTQPQPRGRTPTGFFRSHQRRSGQSEREPPAAQAGRGADPPVHGRQVTMDDLRRFIGQRTH